MLLNIDGAKRFSLPGEKPRRSASTTATAQSADRNSKKKGSTNQPRPSHAPKERDAWIRINNDDLMETTDTAMDLFRKFDARKREDALKRERQRVNQVKRKRGLEDDPTTGAKSAAGGPDQENRRKRPRNREDGEGSSSSPSSSTATISHEKEQDQLQERETIAYKDDKMHNSLRRVFNLSLPSFLSDKRDDISSTKSFTQVGIHPLLQPFPTPTKIQANAIPHLLAPDARYPLLLQSETGSGKTLAFVLPLVQKLLFTTEIVPADTKDFRALGTLAVIIAPTRELAKQIHDIVASVINVKGWGDTKTPHSKRHWITSALLTGTCLSAKSHGDATMQPQESRFAEQLGEDGVEGEEEEQDEQEGGDGRKPSLFTRTKEKRTLRKGVTILVCTPGRLVDHLEHTSAFNTSNLAQIIIDEADHTVDLGMSHLLKQAVQLLRARCAEAGKPGPRLVCTSATVVTQLRYLARAMVPASAAASLRLITAATDVPVAPHMDLRPLRATLPAQLVQYSVSVRMKLRLVATLRIINDITTKAMAFCLGCDMVEYLHALVQTLQARGFMRHVQVHKLHGRMTVKERAREYEAFRESKRKATLLLCTDVAARGLDMPGDVGVVLHVDPPQTPEDYIHRIGRTARAGNPGTSLLLTPLPSFLTLPLTPFPFPDTDPSLFARRGLESLLDDSPPLKERAIKALQTWMQSVARIPGMARGVHLGHVTASFGIGERPGEVLDVKVRMDVSGRGEMGGGGGKWNQRRGGGGGGRGRGRG